MDENFWSDHGIPEAMREDLEMTLLQKVAKSTCMIKAHVVLDRVMDARNKLAKNMYQGAYV